MIKCLLILALITASCSCDKGAGNSNFIKLSPEENKQRLLSCGKLENFDPTNRNRGETAPWLMNIYLHSKWRTHNFHGVLISSRHVLADFKTINLFRDSNGGVALTKCINNTTELGERYSEQLQVHIETASKSIEAGSIFKIIGECLNPEQAEQQLFLLFLDRDVKGVPICLLKDQIVDRESMYTQRIETDNKLTTRKVTLQKCEEDQGMCTNSPEENSSKVSSIPLLTKMNQKLYLAAFGKHSDKNPNGPLNEVTELHKNLICELTGVCRILEPVTTVASRQVTQESTTTEPAILETPDPSGATSRAHRGRPGAPEPTEMSNMTSDWPPPIPPVRIPPILELPVDPLPQNDEDYESEKQLLLEYEQIEREEMEKMEEKKGSEGWNVLMGVGITVLIGLI